MTTLPPIREMQRAYQRSDATYDGVFFVAVRTTGIFCRPSCPARKPLPKNVEYFASAGLALRAGYRPCKRCRPLDANGRPPKWAQQLMQRVERAPTVRLRDADLRAMGVDPARARRFFQREHGMTFQAYQRAMRLGESFTEIRRGGDTMAAGLNHGFESVSGFRDAFARVFGEPPGRARSGQCLVTRLIESPVGPLLTAATDKAVCLLEFTDRRALEAQLQTLRKRFDRPVVPGRGEVLEQLESELGEYFAGTRKAFDVPLDYPGTPFQTRVWDGLLKIPYGTTCSYEGLARQIGAGKASRAVGRANGQNRIAILIPCHRVVNADGKLGGYGGGLWRKQMLLDLERGQRTW